MDKEEFGTKVKDFISKGAAEAKIAFEKAGDKVQDFTDKSVIKISIKKMENELSGKYEELGKCISDLIDSEKLKLSDDAAAALALKNEIEDLKKSISEKEALLQ